MRRCPAFLLFGCKNEALAAGLFSGYVTLVAESMLKIHWPNTQFNGGLVALGVGALVVLGYLSQVGDGFKITLTTLWRKLRH